MYASSFDAMNTRTLRDEREFARKRGLNAVMAKLSRDPKQQAKTAVYGCWQQWQNDPMQYRSKSAFARDMLDAYSLLQSQKKIEDWCREWEYSKQ